MSDDPLRPHAHHNNSHPPSDDSTWTLCLPDGQQLAITLEALRAWPAFTLPAYWLTTDHGVHGPYQATGVMLRDLIAWHWPGGWTQVEVISADGYGNRLWREEVTEAAEPPLLCYAWDGQLLSRGQGLVRLVVPSEKGNALRQVKWVMLVRLL